MDETGSSSSRKKQEKGKLSKEEEILPENTKLQTCWTARGNQTFRLCNLNWVYVNPLLISVQLDYCILYGNNKIQQQK